MAPSRVRIPPSPLEGWQSGRMRRSRKPLSVVRRIEGSNPSPSAQRRARVASHILLGNMPVTVDEVRALAATLPRSHEAHVRGYLKFRIGQIVYLSLAPDGSKMGCGFPKEFRQAAVDAEPEKFSLPSESDMRFNWIHVTLAEIDVDGMRDLVA